MNSTTKTILIIGGIIVAVIIILSVVPGLVWGSQEAWYGMMGPGMMGGGSMFIMPIFWIVIIGLIVWGASAGFNRQGTQGDSSQPDSVIEILKKRYARGEINKEEYESRKRDLV